MFSYKYPFCIESPRQRQLFDQHFGFGLTPQDYLTIVAIPQTNQDYYRNIRSASNYAPTTIKGVNGKFQINLDVQHFAPEEISVKAVDGYLVVEAKHDERRDEHGFISRSFSRRYPLPEDIEPDNVTSKLSPHGDLTVTAPLKSRPKSAGERLVPIIQTGPVKKQLERNEDQG